MHAGTIVRWFEVALIVAVVSTYTAELGVLGWSLDCHIHGQIRVTKAATTDYGYTLGFVGVQETRGVM